MARNHRAMRNARFGGYEHIGQRADNGNLVRVGLNYNF